MPKLPLRMQSFLFRLMPSSVFQNTAFSKASFIRIIKSMENINFETYLEELPMPVCSS